MGVDEPWHDQMVGRVENGGARVTKVCADVGDDPAFDEHVGPARRRTVHGEHESVANQQSFALWQVLGAWQCHEIPFCTTNMVPTVSPAMTTL